MTKFETFIRREYPEPDKLMKMKVRDALPQLSLLAGKYVLRSVYVTNRLFCREGRKRWFKKAFPCNSKR